MDGNSKIVPLALCVCEIENAETWRWFIENLNSYLNDGRHVTFISDRQKGLINAISNTWLIAYHRECSRHVYANFSKSFAGAQLKQLFGKLPRAVTSMILMRQWQRLKLKKKLHLSGWNENYIIIIDRYTHMTEIKW